MAPSKSKSFSKKKGNEPEPLGLTEEQFAEMDEQVNTLLKTRMPLSKTKKLLRVDPDALPFNLEAQRIMAKAMELFIEQTTKHMHTQAVLEKRKTLQTKDLDKLIKSQWMFAFLEDALDDWPEKTPMPRGQKLTDVQTETIQEDEEAPDMEGENETADEAEDDADMTIMDESQENPDDSENHGAEMSEDSAVISQIATSKTAEETDHGLWPPPEDE